MTQEFKILSSNGTIVEYDGIVYELIKDFLGGCSKCPFNELGKNKVCVHCDKNFLRNKEYRVTNGLSTFIYWVVCQDYIKPNKKIVCDVRSDEQKKLTEIVLGG